MNPIFKHGPSPQNRLIFVLILSALLMFLDHKMASFDTARGYLQSMVSPLQYLASAPKNMLDWAADNLTTRRNLMQRNEQLTANETILKEQLLELDIVKRENARLRALLSSPVRADSKKMVAEILSVDSDPYSHQVVINRGANDGLYEGQPVVDENGVVGQVLHVGTISSRVLLITDVTTAVPVRILRNGVRLVANGTGTIDRLAHNFVPHSTDIEEGDVLVTSGLGGKFPEGYPVAKVTVVIQDESRPFARVQSEPIAQIDRLRYLLLLWPEHKANLFSPKEAL
ncbi:rod shape-determining protein MreC [Thalassotalea fusca]